LAELPKPAVIAESSAPNTIDAPQETLGPLDVITVKVFGAPDLGGDYQVDYEGKLKLPLIDEVDALGQTRLTLAKVLEGKYEESYLQNAEVTILLKSSRDRTFTVDGSVSRPGRYAIENKTSLMEAIATSGGVDQHANLNRVLVFREIDGVRNIAGFSLKDIRDGEMSDPEIIKDDIIVVDGSQIKDGYKELLRSLPLLAFFGPF